MSRAYVYEQKAKVIEYAKGKEETTERAKRIVVDKRFKERAILSLALDCHAPEEGIQRFFESVCGESISIGYVSGVLKEAGRRAAAFDDEIDLGEVRQGANDEIFQGQTPVMTGIDVESGFVYLLEEAKDRTGETWSVYMADRQAHGLNLEVTINDGGTGLLSGIPQVYPEVEVQRDIFHALYEMGREVRKSERKAYALIKAEYELKERVESPRARHKTKEKLAALQPEMEEAIRVYDTLSILYGWLRELFGFSGYDTEEASELIEFILTEMVNVGSEYPGLIKETEKVRKEMPALLSFISRLERKLEAYAQESHLPLEALRTMYRQRRYRQESQAHQAMEYELVKLLMKDYDRARVLYDRALQETKKASSPVENLNSRIRVYMNIKRAVPTRFFTLMKVYFNTRRYKRSRCKERIGKSPLELLTGTEQPEFLEALGY